MSNTEFERGSNRRVGDRELILSVGEYAYTRDTTSGVVRVYTGPVVVNVTGQEHPVAWSTSKGRFVEVALEDAARVSPVTPQGHYCVLYNPAEDESSFVHPEPGGKSVVRGELLIGQRINIPGPMNFALWPRQHAKVIRGHNLRSNQYLLVRIYDEEAARINWNSGVVKAAQPVEPSTSTTDDSNEGSDEATSEESTEELAEELPASVLDSTTGAPMDLSVGSLFIIKGTEVSFYIPPTGVEVVPFEDEDGTEHYVRDALTLERLEYCILVDEDGNKRFERGPQVVFPKPTEAFFTKRDKKGRESRIYRPIELNKIQGIYVKVIQEYTEGKETFKEGQELFITGEDTPIYFPRVEHSLVKYDGKAKHFATAVPAGEARYVMNRTTGEVRMVRGPTMLLPDPRTDVVVRRVLSDKQCMNWYPNNKDALEFNRGLRELASRAPTTRRGTVSEGEISRSKKMKGYASNSRKSGLAMGEAAFGSASYAGNIAANAGEEFTRGSTYTEPRTITLDTRFQGVPEINLWTGYAAMIVDKKGNRRVEIGPKQILLEYDEDLEILKLSTGKPKNTDRLYYTPYLRVKNNKVSDIVSVETADHVPVELKLSLRVDFSGDNPEQWFQVENYVKFMCDHVRSVLKSTVRKLSIEEFYRSSEDIIRDAILGKKTKEKRRGMAFPENSMVVSDVEVLNVHIPNASISEMLVEAQHHAVQSSIQLARDERQLKDDIRREEIRRKRAEAESETKEKMAELTRQEVLRSMQITLERIKASVEEADHRAEQQRKEDSIHDARQEAELARKKRAQDLSLAFDSAKLELKKSELDAETEAMAERFKAASEGGLSEALVALDNKDTMVKLAKALSVQRQLGGESFVDVVTSVLGVSPDVAKTMEAMAKKAGFDWTAIAGDNGVHAK